MGDEVVEEKKAKVRGEGSLYSQERADRAVTYLGRKIGVDSVCSLADSQADE